MSGEHKRPRDAARRGGYGSLLGFELKAGAEAGQRFIEALKMF
jgi:O-acetylhomoserine (thiol)-lyase